MQPLLAPLAHLVEAHGGEGPDQGETGGQREDQRQQVVAEHQPRQHQAGDRIDQADEQDVVAGRAHVGHALPQGVPKIGDRELAGDRNRLPRMARGVEAESADPVRHRPAQLFERVLERIFDVMFGLIFSVDLRRHT
ncbi:MAG: hypothetical protein ACXU8S_14900 [Phenylobacterium sp.]